MSRTREAGGPGADWFVRAAGVVGDFGNPFYGEERQRDVWNEASAVGLQLALWLTLATATVAVWVAGEPAVPFAVLAVGLLAVVSLVTMAYAARLGVPVTGLERVLRPRLLPHLGVVALLAVGLVRATPGGSGFADGFGQGLAAGSVLGLVAVTIAAVRTRRRRRD